MRYLGIKGRRLFDGYRQLLAGLYPVEGSRRDGRHIGQNDFKPIRK
jgi:hypothetical protein